MLNLWVSSEAYVHLEPLSVGWGCFVAVSEIVYLKETLNMTNGPPI